MKYTINGKPAYLVARKKGLTHQAFYHRVKNMTVPDAVFKTALKYKHKYKITKNGRYMCTVFSMQQVAERVNVSKSAICGLFYRHGDRIKVADYTIKRGRK